LFLFYSIADKLFGIIENQNQLNLNNAKILSVLKRKIKFDIQVYILALNINLDEFLILGFKLIYDQLYSHVTTENELYDTKSMCNQDTIICVGGADSNDTLLLVSCGSCLDILTNTTINQPRLVNGAWWYFTHGKSFGFAPNSDIKQRWYDCYDCLNCNDDSNTCTDSNRLSWKFPTAKHGGDGFRLGIYIYLYIFKNKNI
jgi:hypothetical protein